MMGGLEFGRRHRGSIVGLSVSGLGQPNLMATLSNCGRRQPNSIGRPYWLGGVDLPGLLGPDWHRDHVSHAPNGCRVVAAWSPRSAGADAAHPPSAATMSPHVQPRSCEVDGCLLTRDGLCDGVEVLAQRNESVGH